MVLSSDLRISITDYSGHPFQVQLSRELARRGHAVQPFDAYPDVLATADVLIAFVEVDAGAFSLPSKVLSYLCAERAIVLSVPKKNLASRIVVKSGAGLLAENPMTPRVHGRNFEDAWQCFRAI